MKALLIAFLSLVQVLFLGCLRQRFLAIGVTLSLAILGLLLSISGLGLGAAPREVTLSVGTAMSGLSAGVLVVLMLAQRWDGAYRGQAMAWAVGTLLPRPGYILAYAVAMTWLVACYASLQLLALATFLGIQAGWTFAIGWLAGGHALQVAINITLQCAVLVGIALFFVAYLKQQLAIVVATAVVWLAGHVQPVFYRQLETGDLSIWSELGLRVLVYAIPDFSRWEIAGTSTQLVDVAYGLGYCLLYLAAAMFVFQKRELA